MIYPGYSIRSLILIVFSMQMVGLSAEDTAYSVYRDLRYSDQPGGSQDDRTLDLYSIDNLEKRPVVIYIHGGGWAFGDKKDVAGKPDFFIPNNIAFISSNYRLRWEFTVFDQVSDLVSVLKWVRTHSDQYGLDPSRIILMGNGSGAHLVSLLGTDERYLRAGGLSFVDVAGIVSVDNEVYDIPRHIEETASAVEKLHLSLIFGEDPEAWRAASPSTHVKKGKNIPAFALLYSASNDSTRTQANAFGKLLAAADVETILVPDTRQTSDSIDDSLGAPEDPTTLALITYIRAKI